MSKNIKNRAVKSKIAKSRFIINEQRIRIGERIKKINWKKPFGYTKKITPFIRRKPFTAFFVVLFVLALLILLGSTVFKTKPVDQPQGSGAKEVKTFKIGSSPKISVQAQVEKTGVIQIVAQSPGIVWSVNTIEGEYVGKGKTLVNLSSNYYGANIPAISASIAQNQYKLSKDTLDVQKELIQKQKTVAERSDANNDEMRDIANKSLEETRGLLDINEGFLNTINSSISQNEATNSAGVNDPAILQANAQKAQLLAVVVQLRQGVRTAELQAGADKPPADLSNLQREITLKNLEIQEKSLLVNHEIARLQAAIAGAAAASMAPASPFNGVVEKVHVRVGESVNPGDLLVTISGIEGKIVLDAKVPAATAKNLSKLENSIININGKNIEVMPAYVSGEATSGQLYSVIYHVPDEYQAMFTDKQFVTISIPIGNPDTNSVVPFIPLDSVFQTQEDSIVYVIKDGKAEGRKIQLGDVQGSFVAVDSGINPDEEIILSRNVVEGDAIKINQ